MAAALLAVVGCVDRGSRWPEPASCIGHLLTEIRCTLTAPPEVRVGEPIPLRLTLENRSGRTLHLHRSNPYLYGRASPVFVVRSAGRPVEYAGEDIIACSTNGAAAAADYLTLAPGATFESSIDLIAAGYRMTAPGIYEIDHPGRVGDLYGGSRLEDARPLAVRPWRDFRRAILYCNRAVVRVLPAGPDARQP